MRLEKPEKAVIGAAGLLDAYGRLAVDAGHLRERVKALEGDVGDLEGRLYDLSCRIDNLEDRFTP